MDLHVRPDTTFQEIDDVLVERFDGLNSDEFRVYGLSKEFENSSINIIPDHMMETVNNREQYTSATDVTVADLVIEHQLTVDHHLSMASGSGEPTRFDCRIESLMSVETMDMAEAQDDFPTEEEYETVVAISSKPDRSPYREHA